MNECEPIRVGDRVRHVSGGPVMTVEAVDRKYARCIWFDAGDHLHKRHRTVKELVRVATPLPLRRTHRWQSGRLATLGGFKFTKDGGSPVRATNVLECAQCGLVAEVQVPHEIDGQFFDFAAPPCFTAPCL